MSELYQLMQTHYLTVARYIFVVLVFLIVWLISRRLKARDASSYILAVLDINDGEIRLPIQHYETTIGRSRSCDVVIPLEMVSRQHAVLHMNEDGRWGIADTRSMGGIFINGDPLKEDTLISIGDEISLAGVKMVLMPATSYDAKTVMRQKQKKVKERISLSRKRRVSKRFHGSTGVFSLIFINVFQGFACYQLYLHLTDVYRKALELDPDTAVDHRPALYACFLFLALAPWIYLGIKRLLHITDMAAETMAFFLCTIGICTTASAEPSSLYKQLAAMVLGIVIFCILCVILRNLHLVMKLRIYAGIASLVLLIINIVFGTTLNGQNNWIDLGFITVQPSEFVKILFVFTGSATLEWLLTTKNVTILTIYSVACIGCLFVMGDFGTALIFFAAYLVLTFMTSGDIRALVLTLVAAGLGAVMILSYKPYILNRFSAWGHVWEHANEAGGFQQTRALMAIASGGLLGLGGGNGFLKNIFASDTDLVFGVICEEWGLLIGLMVVLCYVLLMISAIRSHQTTRSSYYIIAACATASIFLFQASLNIFGTTDVLPLTGVTLPFISNGGSSMAASWGLLSFITAARNFSRPKAKLATAPIMLDSPLQKQQKKRA